MAMIKVGIQVKGDILQPISQSQIKNAMHFFTAPINSTEPSLQKMFKKSIIPIYLGRCMQGGMYVILRIIFPPPKQYYINKTLSIHMEHPFHCSKSAVGQSVCVIRARQCHQGSEEVVIMQYLFLNKCCFRQKHTQQYI